MCRDDSRPGGGLGSITYGRIDPGLAAAVGAVLVVASLIAVRDGTVGNAERSVFRAINDLPDSLKAPMWVFQLLGLLATPVLLGILALRLRRRRLGIGLLATIPLKFLFERGVIKALVERQRPGTTVPDAIIRDASVAGLSFPSGHALFAFAIAGLVAPYLTRNGRIAVYVLAGLNGIARIYLGAHNPLDIVAGAGLGAAIAAVLNLALKVPIHED